jgi:NADH dehydrogenase (ubiquinone) 1 beta subcomplex subunit 8
MHEYEEMLSMWGPDVPTVQPSKALRYFAVAATCFVSFGTLVYVGYPAIPAVRREYPYGGLVTELGGLDANKVRHEPASIIRILSVDAGSPRARGVTR